MKVKNLEKTLSNKLNASVNKMEGLSKNEKKELKDFAQELLFPTRGIDIPRPIPSKANRFYRRGMFIIESAQENIMFQVKPDPFRFLTVTQSSSTTSVGVGNLPTLNYGELGQDDAGDVSVPGGAPVFITYPLPASMVGGTNINNEYQPRTTITSQSGSLSTAIPVGVFNQDFRFGVNGWSSVDLPAQTITARIGNYSPASFDARLVLFRLSGGALSVVGQSTVSTLAPNLVDAFQITLASTASATADETLGLGVLISAVSGANFYWEQLVLAPTFIQINGAAGHLATQHYTFGQALFQGDPVSAERIDQLFVNSKLYAPISAAMVVNVSQVLKDRGGNFLAAYLPSRTSVPADPSDAWVTLVSYGSHYPVATNPFAKGAHASWVGERIQDYEFRRPFQELSWQTFNYDSLPLITVLGQRAVSEAPSTATWYLELRGAFAIKTLDPTIQLELSPPCPFFLMLYLSIVAVHPLLVGENPDHLARLAKLALQFVEDPRLS